MNIVKKLAFVCAVFVLGSCASMRTPDVVKTEPIDQYKYAYVAPTEKLTSGSKDDMRTVNPRDVIAGTLMKSGFVVLPELKPELKSQTLVINYGETDRVGGSTIEIMIQFLSAETNKMVGSCSAYGKESIEADAIRTAIRRALYRFFEMPYIAPVQEVQVQEQASI